MQAVVDKERARLTVLEKYVSKVAGAGAAGLAKKVSFRAWLLRVLKPVDEVTKVSALSRALRLTLWSSPLIAAAPFVYSNYGPAALLYHVALPATLLVALLFLVVKKLQKSPWSPLWEGSAYSKELEALAKAVPEVAAFQNAVKASGRALCPADLKLIQAMVQELQGLPHDH